VVRQVSSESHHFRAVVQGRREREAGEAPPERVTFPVFKYIEGKGFYTWWYMKGLAERAAKT